jgi:hypothetical protein
MFIEPKRSLFQKLEQRLLQALSLKEHFNVFFSMIQSEPGQIWLVKYLLNITFFWIRTYSSMSGVKKTPHCINKRRNHDVLALACPGPLCLNLAFPKATTNLAASIPFFFVHRLCSVLASWPHTHQILIGQSLICCKTMLEM